ncbi:hypothetical protein TraAM80_07741 [Trypanosoma rangeli]|uniref:Kinesin motor domain-containing protein n=1 Tax=Trypanosoma rangeli TaxID=5698 RepID=A0A3R7MD43_TRYRA|nr:uncharacterized protein TraAM80_07741 [Trypanosoma rangeli]RNF00394.1 hypothetical protein TraAM80_07741 [Trypanosoma rangeli]|eukprot:RNF00394.1 hypothetical protein TraAM80_07741 [Trypanosoma rangeli]
MHPAQVGSDGRVTVALNLSAGRCTAVENNRQRSTICIVHGDPATGNPAGLAMPSPSEWGRTGAGEADCGGGEMLVVRTPFLTVEGGETETLPYSAYTRALAAHVATILTEREGAELLTVAHGAAGSGKSIQLFGPIVGGSEVGRCGDGHGGGLLAAVLQRIFAAVHLDPSVALSVVECRPAPDDGDRRRPCSGTGRRVDDDEDAGVVAVEAVDLLARATDKGSPTGCFMEDYADIPATRYLRCSSAAEAMAVLHTALSHSLAWQPVRTALAQGSADVFGLPDIRWNAERRRRAAEAREEEEQEQQREAFVGAHCTAGAADFLRPTAGASSHILVTLLLRHGGGAANIWRMWDLSGPSVWADDGTPASRLAFNTHTAVSLMAHRYMHRDQLQGGWWSAASLPEHIAEIVPLASTHQPHGGRGDPVTTMIEATLQHSCSAVVWIASLRFDACFDDVNGDVLEAAAALLTGGDGTNGEVIAELRRRRRQENVAAASRVMDLFAVAFSSAVWRPQRAERLPACATPPNTATPPDAAASVAGATTPTSASRWRRLISPERGAVGCFTAAGAETRVDADAGAPVAPVMTVDIAAATHHASGASVCSPPGAAAAAAAAAAAVLGTSPWVPSVDCESCLEAPSLHKGQTPSNEPQVQRREGHNQSWRSPYALPPPPLSLRPLSPSPLLQMPPVGEKVGGDAGSPGGASPLSPPSVVGTEYPEKAVTTAHNLNWKELLWETASHDGDVGGEDVPSSHRGTAAPPGRGPTDLASTVRLLLEEPLAQLREISAQYEEDLALHRQRVAAELGAVLSSHGVASEGRQRRFTTWDRRKKKKKKKRRGRCTTRVSSCLVSLIGSAVTTAGGRRRRWMYLGPRSRCRSA